MEYSTLGRTGLSISRVGFGCAPMGGYDYGKVNDDDSIKAVRRALDLGINFFDTADIYGFGHAEEILSKALGDDRHRVVIATKFGLKWDDEGNVSRDCSSERLVTAIEDSLRRLKLDIIPLYQVHWIDPLTPLEDTLEGLLKCQKEGKIRWIGLSNVDIGTLERARKAHPIVSMQSSYNLLRREIEEDILLYCRQAGITFIAHTPLARGFLTGKYGPNHTFKEPDTRSKSTYFSSELYKEKRKVLDTISVLASKYDKTRGQIALRWILESPFVSSLVLGMKNLRQVEEGTGALEWALNHDDYEDLSSCSEVFKTSILC
jgi:aryl-alcohol dehydrogenase-like predicted oxidoreductase